MLKAVRLLEIFCDSPGYKPRYVCWFMTGTPRGSPKVVLWRSRESKLGNFPADALRLNNVVQVSTTMRHCFDRYDFFFFVVVPIIKTKSNVQTAIFLQFL